MSTPVFLARHRRPFRRIRFAPGLAVVVVASLLFVGCGLVPDQEVDLVEPRRLALHSDGTRAWVLDHALDAVVEVDLDTGRSHVVSGGDVGVGAAFDFAPLFYGTPPSIVFDESGQRLLVATIYDLVAVDIASGDRTVVSPGGPPLLPGGPPVFSPQSIALVDDGGQTALVTSIGDATLHSVDLATGEREPVSRTHLGEGDDVAMQGTVAYDAAHDRAILWTIAYTYLFPALYIVDLETGDRELVYITEMCGGDLVGICDHPETDMALNPDGGLAWVTKGLGVWAIDLATGDATLVSGGYSVDELVGDGPLLHASTGIAHDPVHERLVVTGYDTGVDPVIRGRYVATIDLATGDRTIVHPVIGDEPEAMP